ncbi:MAG TPA: D-Ala-D-Ala carboxypeptidase family metallohydrolase [Casimicrobiaceae bacterium]|jgi:zinc D-Ala-D-Ala carboxypeptidase|nr:D-Ala-D-Ala carboxypeptidase family metallohydrolase [Casimicrobiaceae bacterium]
MHLTEHFTLEELTASETAARRGIDNVPMIGSPERANLQRMAEVMEEVRALLGGRPIFVTSGYRGPKVNEAVGGSKNSAHMRGLAVDFACPDFGAPPDVCKALEPHMRALGVDQLINEYPPRGWVHLGLSDQPRHQAMTIDAKGARHGFA